VNFTCQDPTSDALLAGEEDHSAVWEIRSRLTKRTVSKHKVFNYCWAV